jgi:uncharacterized peroxidase-related enzyme
MTAFLPVDPAPATGNARDLLAAVRAKLGIVPNMTRHMARSPAVLEGYLGLSGALAGGTLGAKLAEQVALATAEANGCEYCLSAHTMLGQHAGLTAADIVAAREGTANDERSRAALHFARALIDGRGRVPDGAITAMRDAGFDDGAIGEVVAHVALNVFTNYFNNVTRPVVDFPVVRPHLRAAA